MANENALLTFKEAMSYLRVSRSTLERFINSGRLAGYKVGRTRRFYREDLQACVSREVPRHGKAGDMALNILISALSGDATGDLANQLKNVEPVLLWGIVKRGDEYTVQQYDANLDICWLLHGDTYEPYLFDNLIEAEHICNLLPTIMRLRIADNHESEKVGSILMVMR